MLLLESIGSNWCLFDVVDRKSLRVEGESNLNKNVEEENTRIYIKI